MQTLLERIKLYLEQKNITIAEMERRVGMSNGAFASQVKNGKSIGVDKLEKILSIYPINKEWLFTGIGEMDDTHKTTDESIVKYLTKTDILKDKQVIPLYDVTASAGVLSLYDEEKNILDYISIPNMPNCDGALPITGDSMYPLLKSGDIVLFKILKDFDEGILWGEMYLIRIKLDGEYYTLVKYIQKSEKGEDWIKLVSQNPHHASKDVRKKNLVAVALVKGSIRYALMS